VDGWTDGHLRPALLGQLSQKVDLMTPKSSLENKFVNVKVLSECQLIILCNDAWPIATYSCCSLTKEKQTQITLTRLWQGIRQRSWCVGKHNHCYQRWDGSSRSVITAKLWIWQTSSLQMTTCIQHINLADQQQSLTVRSFVLCDYSDTRYVCHQKSSPLTTIDRFIHTLS